MNKTTKGSLAAGAAAVLLLGGAGSLAFWTDDASINGGTITSGDLTLDAGVCEDWTYVSDGTTAADSAGQPVELFVPGDVITNTCTFVVGATGDNLEAAIAATDAEFTAGGTSLTLEPETTYAIDGDDARDFVDGDLITSLDDGATITATIEVEIPFGTADGSGVTPRVNENDTQNITTGLEDITIALTQVDPNA
jgi:alternate signal-mediated exported protein